MEQQGSQYSIFNTELKEVGVSWFDMKVGPHFQHCIVVGIDDDRKGDSYKTCYILVVRELSSKVYERVGVGKIEARCVSKEACEGRLL
jgi:hypothetical protein